MRVAAASHAALIADAAAPRAMVDIRKLAEQPRPNGSPGNLAAADYLVQRATDLGWKAWIEETPVTLSRGNINDPMTTKMVIRNVVAERPGQGDAHGKRGLFIAGAHYDSVPGAPGANDDATGSAALLEIARVLGDRPTQKDVRLVWFDAEENGLVGSRRYVHQHAKELVERSASMLAVEMLGSPNGTLQVNHASTGDGAFAAALMGVATEHGLPIRQSVGVEDRSDHAPFAEAGIPSGIVIAANGRTVAHDDPNYHSPRDTPEALNQRTLEAGLDAAVAMVARAAGASTTA